MVRIADRSPYSRVKKDTEGGGVHPSTGIGTYAAQK